MHSTRITILSALGSLSYLSAKAGGDLVKLIRKKINSESIAEKKFPGSEESSSEFFQQYLPIVFQNNIPRKMVNYLD